MMCVKPPVNCHVQKCTGSKALCWKKFKRKERKKFSKLLNFSTDCSQSMGRQSVIKIRGKTSKLFALYIFKTGQPELFDPKLTRHFLQYCTSHYTLNDFSLVFVISELS
jgi:hypothetical protein